MLPPQHNSIIAQRDSLDEYEKWTDRRDCVAQAILRLRELI
jgi:hypothetical protein